MDKKEAEKKVDTYLWGLANRKDTALRVAVVIVLVFVAGWFGQDFVGWLFH